LPAGCGAVTGSCSPTRLIGRSGEPRPEARIVFFAGCPRSVTADVRAGLPGYAVASWGSIAAPADVPAGPVSWAGCRSLPARRATGRPALVAGAGGSPMPGGGAILWRWPGFRPPACCVTFAGEGRPRGWAGRYADDRPGWALPRVGRAGSSVLGSWRPEGLSPSP